MWEILISKPNWTGFCMGNLSMFCLIVAVIVVGIKQGWWDKEK